MAKRNKVFGDSELENAPLESLVAVVDNIEEHGTYIKLRSKFPAKIKAVGQVSGKTYIFPEAGSEMLIYTEDVPALLAWRIGETACCGGAGKPNEVFELA